MTQGLRRTASTNTFKHTLEAQQDIKKRDYLVESQLTFNWKYHESQKQLRGEQKRMDVRLAEPKKKRDKMPIGIKSFRTIQY